MSAHYHTPEKAVSTGGKKENFSNRVIMTIFLLYTLSFSLLIPAYPKLLLNLTNDKSGKSSLIYGAASSLRYTLEFFSSPYLGSLSDHVGRKPILVFSLASLFAEFLLITLYPSIISVILSKVISGVCDVTFTVAHAIVADIASRNEESVTAHFGSLGAVLGFGFIFGPLIGSIIVTYSIRLCFALSAIIALLAVIITIYFFEESNTHFETYSEFNWNPFVSLKLLYEDTNLRSLSIPYILLYLSHGVHFIWILLMHSRFGASIIDTGIYLSLSGILGVGVQGFLIRYIVPNKLNERNTALICMVFTSVQFFCFGLSQNLFWFYVSLVIFSFDSMVSPALLSVIVHESRYLNQGAVQGSLGSLRMLTNIFSSLIFPALFAYSLRTTPTIPGLSLYVSAIFSFLAAVFLKRHLDKETRDAAAGSLNNRDDAESTLLNNNDYEDYSPLEAIDGNNTLLSSTEDHLFVLSTSHHGTPRKSISQQSQHSHTNYDSASNKEHSRDKSPMQYENLIPSSSSSSYQNSNGNGSRRR